MQLLLEKINIFKSEIKNIDTNKQKVEKDKVIRDQEIKKMKEAELEKGDEKAKIFN